ncbi:MAG: hypothetical protein ACT4OC_05865, partial [Bradyrhizobium sp.]
QYPWHDQIGGAVHAFRLRQKTQQRRRQITSYKNTTTSPATDTTTSGAGGKTVSIDRDIDGDGLVDQNETQVISASSALTNTITNYNPNGSVADQATKALSSDGLIRTDSVDPDGNGVIDLIKADATEVDANQNRVETISVSATDGTLLQKTVTATSANGANKIIKNDYNGDGIVDQTSYLTITVAANGDSVTTQKDTNGDGSLIGASQTTISSDGLRRATLLDSFGATDASNNPVYDLLESDVTVVDADQNRTQTLSSYIYANGAPTKLVSLVQIVKGADGITRTIKTDRNGALDAQNNPIWSSIETVAIDTAHNNDVVDTLKIINPDGSLSSATVTTTSADGLSVTTRSDLGGNVDQQQSGLRSRRNRRYDEEPRWQFDSCDHKYGRRRLHRHQHNHDHDISRRSHRHDNVECRGR